IRRLEVRVLPPQLWLRSHRLAARTPASHVGSGGSIPPGTTRVLPLTWLWASRIPDNMIAKLDTPRVAGYPQVRFACRGYSEASDRASEVVVGVGSGATQRDVEPAGGHHAPSPGRT